MVIEFKIETQVIQKIYFPLSLEEEYTPKLFSDEGSNSDTENTSEIEEQKLFEQESTQEDDFEIPAFLRRQKF
jgi:hypothetical protein